MTTLLTCMFRDRCVACQVGQGRMCQCEGGAKIRNGRRVRREIPVWVLQLAIYGASIALVVGLARWLWGAWA